LLVGILLASFAAPLKAQQTGTVRGVVIEAGSSRPLASAEVQVVQLDGGAIAAPLGAITDGEGAFVLQDVPVGDVEVRAAYLGHSARTITVQVTPGGTADAAFELQPTVFDLEEIVVTGAAGAFAKKQLGNTIATVDAAELEDAPITTLSELIQAREPSVVGLTSDGATGSGTRLRIRGSNSLSMSNEPVVYVDGVRVDNSGDMGWEGRGGASTSRLDDINWEAVDRVEILKGAAAATLYGSEASSGVIQVFTKQGSPNRSRITLRFEGGTSSYPDGAIKPNAGFARDADHAAYLSDLFRRDLSPFEVFEQDFATDMLETGTFGTISGDVTGGTDEVQYYLAGRYSSEDGPLGAQDLGGNSVDEMRRVHANASLTLFPREKLSFRATGSFTDAEHQSFGRNNNVGGPISVTMMAKPDRAQCFASSIDSTRMFGASTPVCTGDGNPWGSNSSFPTPRELMQRSGVQNAHHFSGSLSATWAASRSVSLDALVGIDQVDERLELNNPLGSNVDHIENEDPFVGVRQLDFRNHREVTLETKVRWSTEFGSDFTSELVAGGQGFLADTWANSSFGAVYPAPGIEVIDAAEVTGAGDDFFSKVNLGVFAQEQLGYRDWLYLTVGGRFDRNSAFGRDAGAAFYPKASVSAILSDLVNWNVGWLSTFRLRAAYGQSGLQPGVFDKFTTYSPERSSAGGAIRPENIGNAALAPERSEEFELGAEAAFLDGTLGLDVTYWDRTTRDALILRQFPSAGGFTNPQMDNIGRLDASGWEFQLDALVVNSRDVSLSLFGNAAYLSEVITDMGGAATITVSGNYQRHRNQLREGYAPGAFFGARLLPECGPSIDRTCYTPGSTVPYDTNADGAPDSEAEFTEFLTSMERVSVDHPAMAVLLDDADGNGDPLDHFLGKPTPDWQGSLGGTLTLWNRLTLNSLFEYRAGNYSVSNLTDAFRNAHPSLGRNLREAVTVESALLNPATQSDPEARLDAAMDWATRFQSLSPYSGLNLIEDGDFVRWRELSLSYQLPGVWAGKVGLDDVTLTFTGRNLAVWTGYSGTDPEANELERCGGGGESRDSNVQCNFLDATDMLTLPLQRRFAFSVRVGF
jgi:TonB-linked SusC/RagA family outer membrane protein